MWEVGYLSVVHVRAAVLRERACLRVCDQCAIRTGVLSLRKLLAILWFSRSEIYGIPRYDHSVLLLRSL